MPAVRHIDADERRRRLLVRHHLARPAATVEQVAADLVGLHSTDPATVVLSLRARLDPFAVADLEDALYERRTLLRMLAMRRTMFVVPLDLAAVMNASCTRALVPVERRKLVALLEEGGVTGDVDAWIERVGDETVAALRAHGPLPASQLTKLVPDLSRPTARRRRQEVRGPHRRVDADAVPPLGGGPHRQGAAARHVAVEPVPLGADGRLDRRAAQRRRGRGAGRARAAVAARLRAGHARRPRVVDEVDEGQRACRAGRRRRGGRHHRHRRRSRGAGVGRSRRPGHDAGRPRRTRRCRAGRRCCRRSTRRSWGGSTAGGTSVRTARRCSTAPATPARRCGSAGERSARGASSRAAPSSPACSRTSMPMPLSTSTPPPSGSPTGWPASASRPRFPTPLDRAIAAGSA